MKLRLIFALGLFIAALLSCETIRKQSAVSGHNAVKIDEHSVLIPGTTISGEDQDAVTKIFKKYNSSLYRIAVYENGSLKRRIGKMSEMQIGAIAGQYANNAKTSGLTNWTMQIGSPTHVTTTGSSTHITSAGSPTHVTTAGSPTHITTGGSPTHVTTAGSPTHITTGGSATHITKIPPESDALVKEVTPILEKYSQ
jgi:hypothetical protein